MPRERRNPELIARQAHRRRVAQAVRQREQAAEQRKSTPKRSELIEGMQEHLKSAWSARITSVLGLDTIRCQVGAGMGESLVKAMQGKGWIAQHCGTDEYLDPVGLVYQARGEGNAAIKTYGAAFVKVETVLVSLPKMSAPGSIRIAD